MTISATANLWHYKVKFIRRDPEREKETKRSKVQAGAGTLLQHEPLQLASIVFSLTIKQSSSHHQRVWIFSFIVVRSPHPTALTTKHLNGSHSSSSSSSSSSDMQPLWTKRRLFFWCCSFSESSSLWLRPPPPPPPPPSPPLPSSSLHILVLCFWYAHEKARKRRDNRAPARIMSPQREMQLGPRVIQERWWWPRFKVVRDDPQPHLISPWLEFPLWHTHTHTALMLSNKHTHMHKVHTHPAQGNFYFLLFLWVTFVTMKHYCLSFLQSVWVGSFRHATTAIITAGLSVGRLSRPLRHLNVDRNYAPPGGTKARLFTHCFYI